MAAKLNMRKFVRVMPMRVLRIEAGDVLVLQTDAVLNPNQVKQLREAAQEQFGKDFGRIAILTAGLKAGVLRRKRK